MEWVRAAKQRIKTEFNYSTLMFDHTKKIVAFDYVAVCMVVLLVFFYWCSNGGEKDPGLKFSIYKHIIGVYKELLTVTWVFIMGLKNSLSGKQFLTWAFMGFKDT